MDLVRIPDAGVRYRVTSAPQSALEYIETGLGSAKHIVHAFERHGLIERPSVLDFGCGCSRTLQFLHLIRPEWTLSGCDIDRTSIEWDKENIPYVPFTCNVEVPPLEYRDESFDSIYALSVFTHLDRSMQDLWLGELARILKPDGILSFSTNGVFVLEKYRNLLPAVNVAELEGTGFTFVRNILDGVLPDWYQTSLQTEEFLRRSIPANLQLIEHAPQGLGGWQDSNIAHKR